MFITYFEDTDTTSLKELKKYFKKIKMNDFGFFDVNIETSKNIKHPIIQTKVNTGSGLRTVAPLGQWIDILFSEEMFNAMKYGYSFQVHCGYLFDRANLFEQFISELYQLRLSYVKQIL